MLSLKNLARKGLKNCMHVYWWNMYCLICLKVLDFEEMFYLEVLWFSHYHYVKKMFSMLIYLYISINFYSITASPPVRCCGTARLWRVPVPASEHHGPRPHAGPTRVPGGRRVGRQIGATRQDYCTNNTRTWVRHLYCGNGILYHAVNFLQNRIFRLGRNI